MLKMMILWCFTICLELLDNCSRYTIYPIARPFSKWCSMELRKLNLLRIEFLLSKSVWLRQSLHQGWCTCCCFPSKTILLLRPFFGIVVLLSHQCPFARLPPTKLAQDVSCPSWPRPLGHAVKCSLPAMSCALVGQDHWGLMYIRLARPQSQHPCGMTAIRHAVKEIGSLPAVLCHLDVTIAACFLIVVLIGVQLSHHCPFEWLLPLTQLARNVFRPHWPRGLRSNVRSLPAISCALVGRDHGACCLQD